MNIDNILLEKNIIGIRIKEILSDIERWFIDRRDKTKYLLSEFSDKLVSKVKTIQFEDEYKDYSLKQNIKDFKGDIVFKIGTTGKEFENKIKTLVSNLNYYCKDIIKNCEIGLKIILGMETNELSRLEKIQKYISELFKKLLNIANELSHIPQALIKLGIHISLSIPTYAISYLNGDQKDLLCVYKDIQKGKNILKKK